MSIPPQNVGDWPSAPAVALPPGVTAPAVESGQTLEDSQPPSSSAFLLPPTSVAIGVAVIAVAVLAVLSPGEPTGIEWWDAVLRVLFAWATMFLVPLASTRAWLLIAATTVVSAGWSLWLAVAIGAVALAIAALGVDLRKSFQPGLALGAVCALCWLNGSFEPFFGATALFAVVGFALLVLSAHQNARERERQWIWIAVVVSFLVGALAALLALFALSAGRVPADRGVDSARSGLAAARAGDVEEAEIHFANARSDLTSAAGTFRGPVGWPGRLVPVIAQHLRAATIGADRGADLADAASVLTGPDGAQAIRLVSGGIDLSELDRIGVELRAAGETITTASDDLREADSRWLLPQLRDQLGRVESELDEASTDTVIAAAGVDAMADMLGGNGSRTWLVILSNPAESREFGGFVGAYAVLETDEGRLRLSEFGDNNQLVDRTRELGAQLDDPDAFPPWYVSNNRVDQFPQNLTGSPNLAVINQAARELYEDLGEGPLNGVILMDPFAVEALIGITGPVEMTDLGVSLGPTNTAAFLTSGQYLAIEDNVERNSVLQEALQEVLTGLLETTSPSPQRLGELLGPVALAGRFQVATDNPDTNDFFRSVDMLHDFPEPGGYDFVSVVQFNSAANKLDAYLERTVTYDVTVDPSSGEVTSVLTAELRSLVPADLPRQVEGRGDDTVQPGEMHLGMSAYSALDVVRMTQDGQELDPRRAIESGWNRTHSQITIPRGGSTVITWEMQGAVDLEEEYALAMANQPLVNNDTVTIRVSAASSGLIDAATGEANNEFEESFTLERDTLLRWIVADR